jgi:hypothetical protein
MKAATTIHFNDNTHITLTYDRPESSQEVARIFSEGIEKRALAVETGGDLLIIPSNSVKYIQVTPKPEVFPGPVLEGCTLS